MKKTTYAGKRPNTERNDLSINACDWTYYITVQIEKKQIRNLICVIPARLIIFERFEHFAIDSCARRNNSNT